MLLLIYMPMIQRSMTFSWHIVTRNKFATCTEFASYLVPTEWLVLNTYKTKVMLITSRQRRLSMQNPVLSLTYRDIDIRMTHADKILGGTCG